MNRAQQQKTPRIASGWRAWIAGILTIVAAQAVVRAEAVGKLKISPDGHFILNEDGSPFFYLGDTGWELFHRLSRQDSEVYLKNRASKRFTVIQAVVLAEFDGLHAPNAEGQIPLVDDDPTKPNEKYFEHVDWVVDKARSLGLYIGMLPTWGDKWFNPPDKGGIFTPTNAESYGRWIGARYRDKPIIWILGGDREVRTPVHREILIALARGLREGDGGSHLITMHPNGGHGSSHYFPDAGVIDFDMWQNGHCAQADVWDRIGSDWSRAQPRPVIDGEPLYEDHPICFAADKNGFSIAADVRHFLYWDLFSGACGHTYGDHCIWQFFAPGREPVNGAAYDWHVAMDHPGAGQMQHARALIESRPVLTRVPDSSLLASSPGAGLKRIVATRASDGAYAMVYIPASRPFSVHLDRISGSKVTGWWFNPRDGSSEKIGNFATDQIHEFTPPDFGENLDWVLVLDDASRQFPPPGGSQSH